MAVQDITREAVRRVLLDNPGIRAREVAQILGIHRNTVQSLIAEIRAEWKEKAAGE